MLGLFTPPVHVRVTDRSILSGGGTEPVLCVLGWVLEVHALGGLFEGHEGETETEPARV